MRLYGSPSDYPAAANPCRSSTLPLVRRLLLLNTDLEIGGTPTVVRDLAVRLRAASGAHVEVACLAPWGPMADLIQGAGISVTPLNARGAADVRVLPRLVSLLRGHQIDTVFSFLVHANAVAAAASRVCRGVRFFQSIQTTQPYPRWHWRVQKLAQRAAEKIVTPSESVAQAAREWAGVPAERIVVIPNAIDPGPAPEVQAGTSGLPIRIGFLGRLDPVKRVPDLLQALQLMQSPAQLHIFGEGEERTSLKRQALQMGLGDRAVFHGASAGPGEALRQMDVLALPSQAEGFPLVLIEAMAAGVPIVATRAPGIRDVIRDNETGILVPIGSPAELAVALDALARDPDRRAALAAAGRRDVCERFTWERVMPQYLGLLAIAR